MSGAESLKSYLTKADFVILLKYVNHWNITTLISYDDCCCCFIMSIEVATTVLCCLGSSRENESWINSGEKNEFVFLVTNKIIKEENVHTVGPIKLLGT